jgi:hypothetical protein
MTQLDRVEQKIDKVTEKLDGHLERISKAETSIMWIQGHLKLTTTIVITIVSAIVIALLNGEIKWLP